MYNINILKAKKDGKNCLLFWRLLSDQSALSTLAFVIPFLFQQ